MKNGAESTPLSVNPRKPEMVLFTRKRKLGVLKAPALLDTTLSFASEVKYLEVTFDAKLTYNLHNGHVDIHCCRKTNDSLWNCGLVA